MFFERFSVNIKRRYCLKSIQMTCNKSIVAHTKENVVLLTLARLLRLKVFMEQSLIFCYWDELLGCYSLAQDAIWHDD
jgi:hypothetical protein